MEVQTSITISGLLKLCCRTSFFPQRLKNWTLLQIQPFLVPFHLQWMNIQKYLSWKIHQADLASPTHQTFCLLLGVQRDLLVHVPPHKGKPVQATTFVWVYFTQTTRHILTINPPPKCLNQVKTIVQWKDTIINIIYFIKYSCGGFGKIWIKKLLYVIFHILYHSVFYCLVLRWQWNITSHSPLTCYVLISGNVSNSLPPFDDPNLKPINVPWHNQGTFSTPLLFG